MPNVRYLGGLKGRVQPRKPKERTVSAGLSLLRQIICLLPAFYLLSRIGLSWCWLAFPIAEIVTTVVGTGLYRRETKHWNK